MKIAVVAQRFSIGGYRVLYRLLSAIKNNEITLFLCSQDPVSKICINTDKTIMDSLKNNGIKIEEIEDWDKLSKRINNFDIALFYWPFYCFCPKNIKIPFYFLIHDLTSLYDFALPFCDSVYLKSNLISFLENGGIPIVLSEYGKKDFFNFFGNVIEPKVIHWSIFSNKISCSDEEENKILKKFNLESKKYFIYPTNTSLHKNIQLCVGITDIVKKKYPGIACVLCGYGTESLTGNVRYTHIDKRNSDFYNIYGLGVVSDEELYVLIKNAICLITTTFAEGGCGPASDAWVFGTPTVISDIPVLREYSELFGVKTEFASPFNANEFADKIIDIKENPDKYLKIVEYNKKAIVENYTWKNVAKQYLDIFKNYVKDYKYKKWLAVDLTFLFQINVTMGREGFIVYTKHLLDALLRNSKYLNLEIWCYSYNVEHYQRIFKDLIDKYAGRIKFCDEKLYETDYCVNVIHKKKNLKYHLKSAFYNCCYAVTKNIRYRQKRQKMKDKLIQNGLNYLLQEKLLQKSIQVFSRASYCYIPFVNLKAGKYFSCPKFLQIHDLFTMIPEITKLFTLLAPNINKDNQKVVDNLNEYAKLNTKFITSNIFTRDEEILKYTDIKKNNVNVVTFPPMIRYFSESDSITEKEIMHKYKIDGNYMFYPSQNRPNKNLIVLLKALKELKDEGIIVKLVTTGRIDSYPLCLEFVKQNKVEDLIIEIGMIPESDLCALYKYSTLSVVTTKIEGLGMPGQTLEALSLGNVPVICSKCLGVKESLESVGLNFETADLNWFEPDDYKDLTKKIQDVLADPNKHIKKQKNIISCYTKRTWDDVAKDYLKLIKDVN